MAAGGGGSSECRRCSAAPRLSRRSLGAGTQDREGLTRLRPTSHRLRATACGHTDTATSQHWLEARHSPSHTPQHLVI